MDVQRRPDGVKELCWLTIRERGCSFREMSDFRNASVTGLAFVVSGAIGVHCGLMLSGPIIRPAICQTAISQPAPTRFSPDELAVPTSLIAARHLQVVEAEARSYMLEFYGYDSYVVCGRRTDWYQCEARPRDAGDAEGELWSLHCSSTGDGCYALSRNGEPPAGAVAGYTGPVCSQ